jgi:hypothetical protein
MAFTRQGSQVQSLHRPPSPPSNCHALGGTSPDRQPSGDGSFGIRQSTRANVLVSLHAQRYCGIFSAHEIRCWLSPENS